MENTAVKPEPNTQAYTLSPRQEELLFAALNSNKPASANPPSRLVNPHAMAPASLYESPLQQAPGSGTLDGFEESPFVDYGYDFDIDNSFDYDFNADLQGQMIGKLPGTSSDGDADGHDKRNHPDDDGEDDEGGGKRREGEEKTSKKPGRKPLTSEPTSKRKAQNRAAQRAFRERKEKHLKDLETKVEDLQKASESANHENAILRSQVEKMSVELREYKKRLSLTASTSRSPSGAQALPSYLAGQGLATGALNNPNEVNFQFEFPRFGRLPGPPLSNGASKSVSPPVNARQYQASVAVSPRSQSLQYGSGSSSGLNRTSASLGGGDMSFSGMFTNSPTLLDSAVKSPPTDLYAQSGASGSRSSTDSANGQNSTGHNTNYSSPSASTHSNPGASSSCGTSPEPSMQSPIFSKPAETTLTTIGEERPNDAATGEGELTFCEKLNRACGNSNNPVPRTMSEAGVTAGNLDTPAFDINGIDWFAQQNGNQFDPQLFGDYREPQDNILSNELFGDGYFADAFITPDFTSPFNIPPSPVALKKDLVKDIDAKINEDDEVVPGEDRSKLLNCNTMWDRLQATATNGEFDLDSLCKDLQKKAKCSETGAVVNEKDFNRIMQEHAEKKRLESLH